MEKVIDLSPVIDVFETAMNALDDKNYAFDTIVVKGKTPEGEEFQLDLASEYSDCDGSCDCGCGVDEEE